MLRTNLHKVIYINYQVNRTSRLIIQAIETFSAGTCYRMLEFGVCMQSVERERIIVMSYVVYDVRATLFQFIGAFS